MKTLFCIGICLTFLTLNTFSQNIETEETSLINKIITWRQTKNLNLGNNQLVRTLDTLSEAECNTLIHNIDRVGEFDDFKTTLTNQNLGSGQYLSEIVAKVSKSADFAQTIYQLWIEDADISKHLGYEYNEIGLACELYGVGRVCVMHLKKSK